MDKSCSANPAAALGSEPTPGRPLPELLQPSNRNLLRIKVPVTVAIASKKQTIGRIVDMAPGSILRFDKSCHDSLDLEVGTRRIAQGECVKIGDRFGLRIGTFILPTERSKE